MDKFFIVTDGMTGAMQGRDALSENGFSASVEKNTHVKKYGCGYGILVSGDKDEIISVLKSNGVNVKKVFEEN